MFDIGLQEMLVISVLALLVFGPSKLPELGRMFGRAMRELRRASDEFRSTVETNLQINETDPPTPAAAPAVGEAPPPVVASLPSEVEGAGHLESTGSAVATVESAEPFSAQRGSRLFHRSQCAWAARIPEPERVDLKCVADARDQGFLACPVCEPWEPG